MDDRTSGLSGLVEELKRRRVFRALLGYGAAVFAILQVADILFAILMLPDLAFSLLALGCLAGFPIVAVLSWIYELTADGMFRADEVPAELRDRRVPVRRWLELIGGFTVVVGVIVVLSAAAGRQRYPSNEDGRVGLAIFPFRTSGDLGTEWSEGAPDLLATALEGTPSLRIVDPWPLWRPLRANPSAAPVPPEVEDAAEHTRYAGAHRFLLGSAIPVGDDVEIALRLYQIGRADPVHVFTLTAGRDELASVVREAAVGVLTKVWGPLRPTDLPAELDFDATRSPDALKAYLAAKEAMRRGQLDSANAAIDRALALDSTFVLAMVEAIGIKSWRLAVQGQPYRGFFQILARAEPHEANLNARTRLRLDATRASIRTDGAAAIAAVREILRLDPLDYSASSSLEFYERIYGWQLGPPDPGDVGLAERVIRLDSTQVPALAARAIYAVAAGDTTDQRTQLRRLMAADTTGGIARGEIQALRAVLASDDAFEDWLSKAVDLPVADLRVAARYLRTARVPRYERFVQTLAASPDPAMRQAMDAEALRWNLARGRPAWVVADIEAGRYDSNAFFRTAQRYLVAADLASVGDSAMAARAAASLMAYVPADSARELFETKPVWWTGWVIGAWHAQSGDTAVARRWIDAIGTLPRGGTSEDYVGSLQADIQSRLAFRIGLIPEARDHARRAYRLWTIHTENTTEGLPEPSMRLHLALLHRASGEPDDARALLYSLVPPTAWFGFLTARASFELGELEEARGEVEVARHHFERARALWQGGGAATAAWLARAEEHLRRSAPR